MPIARQATGSGSASDVMRSLLVGLALVSVACAPQPGSVVSAPLVSVSGAVASGSAPRAAGSTPGAPAACGQSWALEDAVGAGARIIVVCGSDLRRAPVEVGPMTRALDPALDVARERVCACARRVSSPGSVDLVVTAIPQEGRASIEPGEAEGSLDPRLAQTFDACVGSLGATFPAFHDGACADGSQVKYVYALDVELAP